MRLREVSSGVVVHVDDVRGAAMVGAKWEAADKPSVPAKKEPAGKPAGESAPKRRSRRS